MGLAHVASGFREISTQPIKPLEAGRGEADRPRQAAGRASGMYFCWGNGGQLRRVPTSAGGAEVRQAACGERHSLLLLSDGTVHSCGDNTQGQLGRRGKPREERPGKRQDTGAGHRAEQDGALGALGPLGLQKMGNCSALPERSCSSFVFQTR